MTAWEFWVIQSHFQAGWIRKKRVHTDASSSATASGPCTPGAGTADAPMGKGLQQLSAKDWGKHSKTCVFSAPAPQAQNHR